MSVGGQGAVRPPCPRSATIWSDGLRHDPGRPGTRIALHHADRSCRSTSTTTCRTTTPRVPRAARGREHAGGGTTHRRPDRLLGGQPAHRQRARSCGSRAAGAGHAIPERRLLPAHWYGERTCRSASPSTMAGDARAEQRPRCRHPRQRGSSSRSARSPPTSSCWTSGNPLHQKFWRGSNVHS